MPPALTLTRPPSVPSRPRVAAPVPAAVAAPALATPLAPRLTGCTMTPEWIMARRTAIGAEPPASLWITGPESRFSGSAESGFHPPSLRGITHRTIGGSPTESRGFTHRACLESRRSPHFFGSFLSLNLLNDSYLTESFNLTRTQPAKKGNAELAKSQCSFATCRLTPSQKRPDGRRLPGEAKPIRRCVTVSAGQVEGQEKALSRYLSSGVPVCGIRPDHRARRTRVPHSSGFCRRRAGADPAAAAADRRGSSA